MEFSSEELIAISELENHAGVVYGSVSRFDICFSKYIHSKAELDETEQALRDDQTHLEEWTKKEVNAHDEYETYRDDSRKLRNRNYLNWDYATRRILHYKDEIKTHSQKIEELKKTIKELEIQLEELYAEMFSSCDGLVEYYKKMRGGESPETKLQKPDGNIYDGTPFGE